MVPEFIKVSPNKAEIDKAVELIDKSTKKAALYVKLVKAIFEGEEKIEFGDETA